MERDIFLSTDKEIILQIGTYIDLHRRLQGKSKLGMAKRMKLAPNTYQRMLSGNGKLITLVAGLRCLGRPEPLEPFFQEPRGLGHISSPPEPSDAYEEFDDDEEDEEW